MYTESIKKRKHLEILKFISLIRESHPMMENIFCYGSCYNFYLILKDRWEESIAYYDCNHIITRIDDYYYNITGMVECTNHIPFDQYYNEETTQRVINQFLNEFYREAPTTALRSISRINPNF